MGISEMPDVDFPVVNIALRLDGAAPEVMELDVVDIIEDAVMGIEGLSFVSSSVSQGIANITCNFEMNHDVNVALQEVQNRITQSSNLLPVTLYPPVITKTNPEDQPILWVMVTADSTVPLYQLMMYARNTLKDQLSTLSGVGNITFAGYVDPNLRVWLDEKKMAKYDLTSSDIWAAIQAEQIEQPAGRIEAAKNEMNIRVLGEARSTEDFSKIRINTRGGSANYNPIPSIRCGANRGGAVGYPRNFPVQRQRGGGTWNRQAAWLQRGGGGTGSCVKKSIRSERSLLPGYHIDVKLDQTKFIKDSVDELNMTLLLSAILTSIICYLFLGSWSSTINVLLAIPTSIVGAFIALYFLGFTLNTFTLLGLESCDRYRGGRRHHDAGKHRAPLRDGKEPTAGLARRGRGDHLCRPGDDPCHRRDFYSRGFHARGRRPVFLPIRNYGDRGGLSFLARGVDPDTHALRAFPSLREGRKSRLHIENHGPIHGYF